MEKISLQILRIGLAVTFVWVGVLIYMQPETWASLIQAWVLPLLPLPAVEIMMGTAVLDICIGVLFLFRKTAWIAGVLGFLHLTTVLITTGINDITVRDIGLCLAALATGLYYLPQTVRMWFVRK